MNSVTLSVLKLSDRKQTHDALLDESCITWTAISMKAWGSGSVIYRRIEFGAFCVGQGDLQTTWLCLSVRFKRGLDQWKLGSGGIHDNGPSNVAAIRAEI
jgi:hypothetical protein